MSSRIAIEQIRKINHLIVKKNTGKPAEMAEKIAQGRLNKFFKENTLLSQDFIRDNKLSVEKFLESTEKGLTVVEFKRLAMS